MNYQIVNRGIKPFCLSWLPPCLKITPFRSKLQTIWESYFCFKKYRTHPSAYLLSVFVCHVEDIVLCIMIICAICFLQIPNIMRSFHIFPVYWIEKLRHSQYTVGIAHPISCNFKTHFPNIQSKKVENPTSWKRPAEYPICITFEYNTLQWSRYHSENRIWLFKIFFLKNTHTNKYEISIVYTQKDTQTS